MTKNQYLFYGLDNFIGFCMPKNKKEASCRVICSFFFLTKYFIIKVPHTFVTKLNYVYNNDDTLFVFISLILVLKSWFHEVFVHDQNLGIYTQDLGNLFVFLNRRKEFPKVKGVLTVDSPLLFRFWVYLCELQRRLQDRA